MRACKSIAIGALIAAAVWIAAPPAFAQTGSLKIAVPFDFYAAGKLLSAGTYTVSHIGSQSSALRITDSFGQSVFVMTTHPKPKPRGGKNQVVFRRYGEANFLAAVYWIDASEGREVATSPVEDRLAQAAKAASTLAVNVK